MICLTLAGQADDHFLPGRPETGYAVVRYLRAMIDRDSLRYQYSRLRNSVLAGVPHCGNYFPLFSRVPSGFNTHFSVTTSTPFMT
jgi:hypothetical protein